MNARVASPRIIEILRIAPVSHLAVYRDQFGRITSQRALCLPEAGDAEAMEEAKRLAGAGENFCDVFEVVETHRVGGLMFREEAE